MDRHRDCITDKEYKYFTSFDWRTSKFYGLPKIHKCKSIIDEVSNNNSRYVHMSTPDDLIARPIVAGSVSPTQHLSELLEEILKPLVCKQNRTSGMTGTSYENFQQKSHIPVIYTVVISVVICVYILV